MSIFLLAFLAHSAAADLRISPDYAPCIRPPLELHLAHRTGKEGCWVQYRVDQLHTICVSHLSWIHWLTSSQPLAICIHPNSRWRVWSPLENSSSAPKRVLSTLRVEQLTVQPLSDFQKFRYKIWRQVELIREQCAQILQPRDPLGILRSLVLQEGSSKEPLPMLRKLGFVHLFTTTGIHLYALAQWCNRGAQRLAQYVNIPTQYALRCSRMISFLLCGLIWILNGCRVGMLRPWVLLILRDLSTVLGFRWRKASPLALALLTDQLLASELDADEVGASGRWIYALAVGGGLFWHRYFNSSHVGLAVGSWLLVGLHESWHTGTISIATPILSWVTLPLICLFFYPLVIFALFLTLLVSQKLACWVQGLSYCLTKVILLLTKLSLLPGNLWTLPKWSIASGAILSGFLLFYLVHPTRHRNKICCSFVVLAILFRAFLERPYLFRAVLTPSHRSTALHIEQLDVGQGDAALVISTNQGGLIDTGSQRALTDVQWIEFFAKRNLRKLSWVALSHLDEDHTGGFHRLVRLIPIHCTAAPSPLLKTTHGRELLSLLAHTNTPLLDWNSGCIPYPTMSIGSSLTAERPNGVMGAICIPLFSDGFYLSAGDASSQDEIRVGQWVSSLIQQKTCGKCLKILKVSHHGSKTSTSSQFLRTIQPTEAWISSGIGNRYGHPSPHVLETLSHAGIHIRRTDRDGHLEIPIQIRVADDHHPQRKHPLSPKQRRH